MTNTTNGNLSTESRFTDPDSLPWIPLGPGNAFKPLRFLEGRGRVILLRVDPGTVVARHQHTGEVHCFNLEGQRQLATGEVIGPGGYVYEPPGNVDTWKVVGDIPCIIQIVAYGAVEMLGDDDRVLKRNDATSMLATYRAYCESAGIAPLDLTD